MEMTPLIWARTILYWIIAAVIIVGADYKPQGVFMAGVLGLVIASGDFYRLRLRRCRRWQGHW
jgi:hypothetical protein